MPRIFMLTNFLKKAVVFILSVSVIILCYAIIIQDRCFYEINRIRVNELIIVISQKRGINYCSMLRKSFNNDEVFSQFISLKFYDGYGIDHANVVYQLYQYFGSEKFWKKADSLNSEDKMRVEGYLKYAISEDKIYDN